MQHWITLKSITFASDWFASSQAHHCLGHDERQSQVVAGFGYPSVLGSVILLNQQAAQW